MKYELTWTRRDGKIRKVNCTVEAPDEQTAINLCTEWLTETAALSGDWECNMVNQERDLNLQIQELQKENDRMRTTLLLPSSDAVRLIHEWRAALKFALGCVKYKSTAYDMISEALAKEQQTEKQKCGEISPYQGRECIEEKGHAGDHRHPGGCWTGSEKRKEGSQNNFEPRNWQGSFGVKHDMWTGPCSCGAYHSEGQ